MEKINTQNYNTKYVQNFKNFDPKTSKETLSKLKRSFNKNDDDSYDLANHDKLTFDPITKKMISLTKPEIDDKLKALEEEPIKEGVKKFYEFINL